MGRLERRWELYFEIRNIVPLKQFSDREMVANRAFTLLPMLFNGSNLIMITINKTKFYINFMPPF